MPKEIERKFLVSHIPDGSIETEIKQGYLQSEKHRTVRIRTLVKKPDGEEAFLTIKGAGNKSGTSRYEFETEIPFDEATYLLKLCDLPLIEKTRYIYISDNLKWEIDQFHGTNKGLLLAEVELSDINQKVVLPDFIVEEVTGINKYYNSMLQKTPYTLWDNKSSK